MSSRRQPAARRPPPRRRSGSRVWVLLLVAAIGVVSYAITQRRTTPPAPPPPVAEAPLKAFTVPEGLRREEIAARLAAQTRLSGDEYLQLTAEGARGTALAKATSPRSLEGFLFPATYQIGTKTTVTDVVNAQVKAYQRVIGGVSYAGARAKNLTPYDVLIVASLVEREAAVQADRPLIASVIYNRLRIGMRLDIDATTQYAAGSWKTELLQSDLDNPSPYNTRRPQGAPGLPPGPICSPGEASLRAAAQPAKTDFLYYVAKEDGSGGSYFARNIAEHGAAVAKARANRG